jgi:hypothetical protein
MNCQRARVLSRMRRCEALVEDVGLPLYRLRGGRYGMSCQRCEALADHVGLLLKERETLLEENQVLRGRIAELERWRLEQLDRAIRITHYRLDRVKGES